MAAKILSTNTLVRISGSRRLGHHPARPEAPQETSFGSSTFGKDREDTALSLSYSSSSL